MLHDRRRRRQFRPPASRDGEARPHLARDRAPADERVFGLQQVEEGPWPQGRPSHHHVDGVERRDVRAAQEAPNARGRLRPQADRIRRAPQAHPRLRPHSLVDPRVRRRHRHRGRDRDREHRLRGRRRPPGRRPRGARAGGRRPPHRDGRRRRRRVRRVCLRKDDRLGRAAALGHAHRTQRSVEELDPASLRSVRRVDAGVAPRELAAAGLSGGGDAERRVPRPSTRRPATTSTA